MTKGKKRWMSKEARPLKVDLPVREVMKVKVEEVDPSVQQQLKVILKEFKDIFLDKLP